MFRRLRKAFRIWLNCRRQRCSYYEHYLAYGPADMPHATYHLVEDQAGRHFESCTRPGEIVNGRLVACPLCSSYERRLRA